MYWIIIWLLENGYFRIGYSECGIQDEIYSIDFDPDAVNLPPVVSCGGLYSGKVNESIQFDSSETFDVENNIESYEWEFGDGIKSSEPNPTHVYSKEGNYPVKLTVIDTEGARGIDETSVYIDLFNIDDCLIFSLSVEGDWSEIFFPFTFNAKFDYLKFKIIDKTEDEYIISASGKPTGDVTIGLDDFIDIPFNVELLGKMKRTSVDMNIVMKKAGYGIVHISSHIHGTMSLKVKPIPIPLSLPIDIKYDISFNPAFNLFGFTPTLGAEWYMNKPNFDIDGEIKVLFGLFKKSFTLDNGSILYFDEIVHHNCVGMEEITVGAGTYNTYVIEIIDGMITYYYSSEIGMFIKIETHEDIENVRVIGELVSL